MVAHDEEAHALLEEHEPRSEDGNIQEFPASPVRSVKGSYTRRVTVCFIVALLLYTLSAIITSYVAPPAFSENDGESPLEYQLDAQKYASRPPKDLIFNWSITAGIRSPDGVQKRVYLVNDAFPGPVIEARSGDRIVVHVHNDLLDEGVSLHWHGLRMKDQNAMDGAVGFTQSPIAPTQNFTYDLTIGDDEYGTFWWHSHYDVQRADGLWGGLVIHSPEEFDVPQEDHLIIASDWFHRNQTEVLESFADASSRGNEPVPDSFLVNGQGHFNCTMAVPARPVICSQVVMTDMKPLLRRTSRRTRLRFVNAGSIAGFTIRIDGAKLQPVRVDGGYHVRSDMTETVGIIYPGERVDLDVEWDGGFLGDRWLTIYMDDENFGYPNPALDPIQRFPVLSHDTQTSAPQNLGPNNTQVLDPRNLQAATKVSGIPPKAEQTILLYAKTEKLAHLDYEPVGFMNHTSWKPQSPPLISQNQSQWDENQLIPLIKSPPGKPIRVDIIINNLDDGAHPFHLHGYSFYVLSAYREQGRGSWGSYNPYSGEPPPNGLNLDFPLRKDTVSVPRRGHVVLTFVADNPGIWALHCHMLVHMARGMAMGLQVGYV
ncbi:putative multicopper oxidase [Fusarium heterosporum]|uniref:Putative multicopper oxidase n=1 Tax=Fusarium heterosporum TaxID=42747 RepID=A0A8H5T7V7_FUSHE|nr:putative multicopper oxidase [Fusarium heterosporum]